MAAHRCFQLRSRVTCGGADVTLGRICSRGHHRSIGGQAAAATETPRGPGTVVVDWNKQLVRIVNTPGAQPATVHPTRSFAILSAAMYDSVLSITHSGSPYLYSINAPSGARADAAAAEAGHDTLLALYPSAKAVLDQQLAGELAAIPDGNAKRQGIEVSRLSAAFMLAARTDDGSSVTPPVFPAGTQPGDWRPAPPALAPAVFTQWSAVTPSCSRVRRSFGPRRLHRSAVLRTPGPSTK
jgi:hypothetical protein